MCFGVTLWVVDEPLEPVGFVQSDMTPITIRTHKGKRGKYGRWLVEILLEDGSTVNQWLFDNGFAVEYMR